MNARHALEVNRIASESNEKSELMANLGDMPNMMIVLCKQNATIQFNSIQFNSTIQNSIEEERRITFLKY
jgi:hypothetical protein